ncbi:hypothetical protein E2C01_000950 [Portunus trituberculatus]|uniref:Uncharacterized protein n=1 Tax=Portunus trituberculatus TaxID=210409 RepID=A0A5B7CHY1_PORTR|nr:hypothetical protein [Portunus trituberculatus]
MGDEEEHVDPKKLTSLSDIKRAYEKLCDEEVSHLGVVGETMKAGNTATLIFWEEGGVPKHHIGLYFLFIKR